jgi:NSS family neurotransmitter:Na+ symporter
MQRETLGSRLGFILISAGCAIGIGNVWRFPYLCGQFGGGAFVLVYLFFLAILGLPAMCMEFAVGRASRKSPIRMYQELEPEGTKWHIHGLFCMAGNYLLMMFYTTVAGWMLQYFFQEAFGNFKGLDADSVAAVFDSGLKSPVLQVGFMAVIVALGFIVNMRGLQSGLERVTKVMMTALIVIMMILAVNSIFLPGAREGIRYLLVPDFARMKEQGIWNVIVAAMNQAFFTLSIGIGSMAIFGSYINKEQSLMGESVNIVLLDTMVAISSGLIIIPACFAYKVEPTAGPGLIFITLPNIFNNMPLGRLWGSLFFVFMTFAAFSTVLAVFENIMAMCMDLFGWSRTKTGLVNIVLVFILSLPCSLGFNKLQWIHPMGGESTFLDLEDYIVSNFLLPLGALVFVLFCTRKAGWGWESFKREADEGDGLKVQEWMRFYITWILPLLIIFVFIMGLI